MSMNVSDFVLQRLVDWGTHTVFGYPGDAIQGLLGAFNRIAKDSRSLRFVQARHEETAALMACGHAKLTGELGVCVATSGTGAIHLLNGLYDAKMDHAPVLAIVGQTARAVMGTDYAQEVDLPTLFKDVAYEYMHVAMTPAQVRHLVDRAVRTALAERTVTCLILPKDVQELSCERVTEHEAVRPESGYTPPLVVPEAAELDAAAAILSTGQRVAMLIGAGARGAETEVLGVAELLGAGIAKALLARDILPDALPFVTGPLGLLGTSPSWEMMKHCDTLLVVGSSFPYTEYLPKVGQARGIQIDLDPRRLGLRYPMELNLAGDAKATLAALLPRLVKKTDPTWRNQIVEWTRAWWKLMEERARVPANPLNPQLVFWELSSRLPERAIVIADSGTVTEWWARDLQLREGMRAMVSGGLRAMGCAIPYAIAAKLACPDRPVIACVGDGAMQMNGMNELLTIQRYASEWKDPRFIVLVLDNKELALVTWEMRAIAGNPKYPAAQSLPSFDYAAYAQLAGFHGIRVEHPVQVAPAWEEALHSSRPVLIDAITDPNVPPLPPHLDLKHLKAFTLSMLKSEDRDTVLLETLRNVLALR